MATAEGKRPSVAFLTTLDDNKGSAVTDTLPNNQNDQTVDSLSTSTSTLQVAPGCSESGSNSNSRVESLSRDSRRGRDVKSAEVDLIRFQPLPGSVRLANVTEKVPRRGQHMFDPRFTVVRCTLHIASVNDGFTSKTEIDVLNIQ